MPRDLKISHAVLGTIVIIGINAIVVAVSFGRISRSVEMHGLEIQRLTTDMHRIDTEGSAVWRTAAPAQRDSLLELIRRVDRIETKLDRLIERNGGDRASISIPDGHAAITRHNPWITTNTNRP